LSDPTLNLFRLVLSTKQDVCDTSLAQDTRYILQQTLCDFHTINTTSIAQSKQMRVAIKCLRGRQSVCSVVFCMQTEIGQFGRDVWWVEHQYINLSVFECRGQIGIGDSQERRSFVVASLCADGTIEDSKAISGEEGENDTTASADLDYERGMRVKEEIRVFGGFVDLVVVDVRRVWRGKHGSCCCFAEDELNWKQ
ncbi:hypothetical protein KCV07_g291, partial [Aureobasidium melanogenum]